MIKKMWNKSKRDILIVIIVAILFIVAMALIMFWFWAAVTITSLIITMYSNFWLHTLLIMIIFFSPAALGFGGYYFYGVYKDIKDEEFRALFEDTEE